jgi:hypothetical protein
VSTDFKTLRRQDSQLGVGEWLFSVVDWNVEGPANSPRPQEFGEFQIGGVAVVPTRGYNPWFFRASQMNPRNAFAVNTVMRAFAANLARLTG